MRFTIEERHLTDADGRPVPASANTVTFHHLDAASIDEAVRLHVGTDGAQLIGDVLQFPGHLAVATLRRATGVYTLQFTPASEAFSI